MFETLGAGILIGSVFVALFAGFVKGAVGFAMPMIMISGLATMMDPKAAIAGLVLPTVVTNIWQALRQGIRAALVSARHHWRFLAILLVMIALSAQLVTRLSAGALYLALGVPVVIFATLMLVGWRPRIPPARRRGAELAVGGVAGAIGGLSGVWGPPTVIYLTALDTPKQEAVRVQGVVYGLGAVMLLLGHLKSGVLTAASLPFSAMLVLPAAIGMVAGFAVQDRLDQERFRTLTVIVLVVAGLNLVRKGIAG